MRPQCRSVPQSALGSSEFVFDPSPSPNPGAGSLRSRARHRVPNALPRRPSANCSLTMIACCRRGRNCGARSSRGRPATTANKGDGARGGKRQGMRGGWSGQSEGAYSIGMLITVSLARSTHMPSSASPATGRHLPVAYAGEDGADLVLSPLLLVTGLGLEHPDLLHASCEAKHLAQPPLGGNRFELARGRTAGAAVPPVTRPQRRPRRPKGR